VKFFPYKILHRGVLIYKKDIPVFHCKMSLDEFSSMREIDGLSLIFIDCSDPALTQRLH